MTRVSSVLFAAIAIAALTATARPAAAIEYPWCAQYGGEDGDAGRNCGFVSWEQCMETVRGMGGFCEPNLFYTGPAERPAKPARKKRRDSSGLIFWNANARPGDVRCADFARFSSP